MTKKTKDATRTTPRGFLVVAAGWVAAAVAVFCVVLGLVGIYLGDPKIMLIVAGLLAAIAIACLSPAKRTPAIQILGATFCAIFLLTFAASIIAPPKDVDFRKRGMMLTFAVFMAGVAYKGRWTGSTN